MMYKAKVAVCSDIRTKHSTQSERHVEFLNVKTWWYVKKPLGFKRLIISPRLLLLLFTEGHCQSLELLSVDDR
jgi:hypothetical protein